MVVVGSLLHLAGSVAAVEPDQPLPTIDVHGQRLVPFFNLSDSTLFTLHPYFSIAGGQDSNVLLAPSADEKSDSFVQGIIGAQIEWYPSASDRLQLRGEYNRVHYQTYDDQAGVRGGNLQLGFHHDDLVWAGFVIGGWTRSNDPLLGTNERALLDAWNSEARLDYRTLTTRSSLGATWARDNYLNDTLSFSSTSRDNDRYEAYVRFAYEPSEFDSVYIRSGPTATRYDEHTQYADSNGWYGVLGSELAPSSLTTLKAEGGVVYKNYRESLPANPSLTQHVFWGPLANLEAKYLYEEQSWIRLIGFTTLKDSLSQAYATYYVGGRLDARKRLLTNAGAIGSIDLTESFDTDAGTQARERTVLRQFRGGFDYALREGLGLQALAGYEFSTAQFADDYQRWIISASFNAAF